MTDNLPVPLLQDPILMQCRWPGYDCNQWVWTHDRTPTGFESTYGLLCRAHFDSLALS